MKVGELVEDFEALGQSGDPIRLSTLLAKGPVVLFFYPKAMSAGCTAQACRFRDLTSEFERLGAAVVGISPDSVAGQAEFDQARRLKIPLAADPGRIIAKQFGVARPGRLPIRRVTFVIGENGRVVRRIASEVDMESHADEALEALEAR